MSEEKEKQQLKTAAFTVEIIADKTEPTTFIVRTVQGQPIRICKNPDEVVEFLNEVTNEIKASYEREDEKRN